MMTRASHSDVRYHPVPSTDQPGLNGSSHINDSNRSPTLPSTASPLRRAPPIAWFRRSLLTLVTLSACAAVWLLLNFRSLSLLLSPAPFPPPLPHGLPVLARTIALILCEGQPDIHAYTALFPSITADAVFYCWKEDHCGYPTPVTTLPPSHLPPAFIDPTLLLVSPWTSSPNGSVLGFDGRLATIHRRTSTLVTSSTLNPSPSTSPSSPSLSAFYPVHPSVWVLNEASLGQRLTWTGSRNRLLQHVRELEERQGWRWAYLTFMDGDVHLACERLLDKWIPSSQSRMDEARVDASYHYQMLRLLDTAKQLSLASTTGDAGEGVCRMAYDAFLLTAAPARGTVVGVLSRPQPGVDAQVGYDMDAMLNSFQSAALAVLLPYCERYDEVGWWMSQILLNARGLCVFGHTLVVNDVHTREELQVHRAYPKAELESLYGLLDEVKGGLRLYPQRYAAMEKDMQHKSAVFPALLRTYSGWWPDLLEPECHSQAIHNTTQCTWMPTPTALATHTATTST